jgi:hypothetical protein
MPLFGVPEWGANPAQNTALPGCDVANCVADLWFRLGFLNAQDLNRDDRWVTLAELYQFGDDAAKCLARMSSLFLTCDASINVVASTPLYNLPAAHVFTLSAWLINTGGLLQMLRLSTVGQLFGLDGNWSATTGSPSRVSLDAGGVGTATLYPNPVANATLAQVLQEYPAAVVAGSSSVPVSPILQDYFTDWLLAASRGKESDSAMPEIAAHMGERLKLYESVIQHLWGSGQ